MPPTSAVRCPRAVCARPLALVRRGVVYPLAGIGVALHTTDPLLVLTCACGARWELRLAPPVVRLAQQS